jgi:hypothetical protein
MPETMREIGSTTIRAMAHVVSVDVGDAMHWLPLPHVFPLGQHFSLFAQRKYPVEHV